MTSDVTTRPLFRRVWAMPSSDTFTIQPIYQLVWKYLNQSEVSVDPFARNNRWAKYTNDLNPETAAEHHMDANDFVNMLADNGVVADLIIVDPPYSPRQVKECYDGIGIAMKQDDALLGLQRKWLRQAIERIAGPTARVLWFGWNTVGMGSGWKREETLLVCHGSDHNDTICVVDRRSQKRLW